MTTTSTGVARLRTPRAEYDRFADAETRYHGTVTSFHPGKFGFVRFDSGLGRAMFRDEDTFTRVKAGNRVSFFLCVGSTELGLLRAYGVRRVAK